MSIKPLQEKLFRIISIIDQKVKTENLEHLSQVEEFDREEFSTKDLHLVAPGMIFKEIEFFEIDENGQKSHCWLITFKKK